jgi:hypothetical protein
VHAPTAHLHHLDHFIQKGMLAATADGKMGANSTGVRRWRKFCNEQSISHERPLDPNASLLQKLKEEWWCMRCVVWLVEEGGVAPSTAAVISDMSKVGMRNNSASSWQQA